MAPAGKAFPFDPILKRVSRSFYLTLRLLPKEIRTTISLAYLLARASDSIADSAHEPVEVRLRALRALPDLPPPISVPGAEGDLLAALPQILTQWQASPDKAEISRVWNTILAGQIFDLEHFPSPDPLTPEDLDRYTYLVAGCVGEFWTDVCLKSLAGYSSLEPATLRQLGIRFGQGLQLVNILRDRAADLSLGRVYIAPDRFQDGLMLARNCLADGTRYSRSIQVHRVRAACELPLRLGSATLDLIEKNPSASRVKVTRTKVWLTLAGAILLP